MSIRWITAELGTAPAMEVIGSADFRVIDVRDLVDKQGNRADTVKEKIDQGVASLRAGNKTVVCCDYGISRSNAVAAGILSIFLGIDFLLAVRKVQEATGEKEIKLEPLDVVKRALGVRENSKCSKRRQCVLLTGGSGFIGRALLPALQHDFDVISPARKDIDIESGAAQLSLLVAERQVDCIVHLANPRIYTSNKAFGSTMSMLRNVIDVCAASKVRLLYLSGWEVYSAYRGVLFADESLPKYSKGPYGDAKYLAELLIEQSVKLHSLRCAILRSGPVYGAGSDRPKFIYNFLEKARAGQKIVTHRYVNGSPALDLMHVDDLIRAIVGALREKVTGDFNLGTGVLTDTFSVATEIVRLLGSSSEVTSVQVDSSVASVAMDYKKASDFFGWGPSISFEDGLRKIIS